MVSIALTFFDGRHVFCCMLDQFWADSPAEASGSTDLQSETQCRPDELANEGMDWEKPVHRGKPSRCTASFVSSVRQSTDAAMPAPTFLVLPAACHVRSQHECRRLDGVPRGAGREFRFHRTAR